MQLNIFGEVIHNAWFESQEIRKEIKLDAFVVMPNHIHGIIWIVQSDHPVGAHGMRPQPGMRPRHNTDARAHHRAPLHRKPRSLSSFMGGFKSACTKQINQIRQTPGAPLWQRGYYDHVIRDEHDQQRIREYIVNNPLKWALDPYCTP